jgi:DNA gyrase subunit A
LNHALEREHILEGLKIAVDNIDAVVQLIRESPDTETASTRLQETFALSERQARAILDMRLARLTGLEIEKLEAELAEVRATIADLRDILENRERRYQIIKDELKEIVDKYGDERRTEITEIGASMSLEDLLSDDEMVITVSHDGYVKRLPVDTYRAQRRGGRGIQGMETKEEDWVEKLFVGRTHDYLMCFTTEGHCYWLKVHEIPQASRSARGKPLVNLLALDPDEKIAAVVAVREFSIDKSLIFVTRRGIVKKTPLSAYSHVRNKGVNAINIREGDELIDVQIASGDDEVILATALGMAIRFHERDIRLMGRVSTGVRGIRVRSSDRVIGMVVSKRELASKATLLVVSERGRGKRTDIEEYRFQSRGGKGVLNFRVTEQTGHAVAIKEVFANDELMLITRNGVVIRQRVDEIRVIGRATQGVRVMALDENDQLVDVARLVPDDDVPMALADAGIDVPVDDGSAPVENGGSPEEMAPAGSDSSDGSDE